MDVSTVDVKEASIEDIERQEIVNRQETIVLHMNP